MCTIRDTSQHDNNGFESHRTRVPPTTRTYGTTKPRGYRTRPHLPAYMAYLHSVTLPIRANPNKNDRRTQSAIAPRGIREIRASRRPEPEERLLFPICDSAPRDTGDPSKSALGAVRTGITLPPSAGIYFWRKYFFQQSFRQVLPFQVVPIGGGDRCEGTSNTRQPPRTRRWQERRPWPARLRSQQPGQDHQWRELP